MIAIFFSRDVVFQEHVFPYKSSSPSMFLSPLDFVDPISPQTSVFAPNSPNIPTFPHTPFPNTSPLPSTASPNNLSPDTSLSDSTSPTSIFPIEPTSPSPPSLRKSTSTIQQPTYLKDYLYSYVQLPDPLLSSSKVSSSDIQVHEPQFY